MPCVAKSCQWGGGSAELLLSVRVKMYGRSQNSGGISEEISGTAVVCEGRNYANGENYRPDGAYSHLFKVAFKRGGCLACFGGIARRFKVFSCARACPTNKIIPINWSIINQFYFDVISYPVEQRLFGKIYINSKNTDRSARF